MRRPIKKDVHRPRVSLPGGENKCLVGLWEADPHASKSCRVLNMQTYTQCSVMSLGPAAPRDVPTNSLCRASHRTQQLAQAFRTQQLALAFRTQQLALCCFRKQHNQSDALGEAQCSKDIVWCAWLALVAFTESFSQMCQDLVMKGKNLAHKASSRFVGSVAEACSRFVLDPSSTNCLASCELLTCSPSLGVL